MRKNVSFDNYYLIKCLENSKKKFELFAVSNMKLTWPLLQLSESIV